MFYGSGTFDPLYILAQIVAVQCLYYLGLGTLLFVLVGKKGKSDQAVIVSGNRPNSSCVVHVHKDNVHETR